MLYLFRLLVAKEASGDMIKKLSIGDIQLDNYTNRDLIAMLDRGMNENSVTVFWDVSAELLFLAEKDERVKEALASVDHTILTDEAILQSAGENTRVRRKEIEENGFFAALMKRLERNHKRIFLLADRAEDMNCLGDRIREGWPRCEIEGTATLESCTGAHDSIINEINAAAVDVVIAALSSPQQEYFWLDHKDKLSASLYYGLDLKQLKRKRKRWFLALRNRWRMRRLRRHITNYEQVSEEK